MSTLLPTIAYGTLKGIIHNLDWALRGIGERPSDANKLGHAKTRAAATLERIDGLPALAKLCKWTATVPTWQELEQLDARLNTRLAQVGLRQQHPDRAVVALTLRDMAGFVDCLNGVEYAGTPEFCKATRGIANHFRNSERHPEPYYSSQEFQRYFCETVANLEQEIRKAGEGDGEDTRADTHTEKPHSFPRDNDAVLLARRLLDSANKGRTKKAIALDFTEGKERRANNLLRSVNRNHLLERLRKK